MSDDAIHRKPGSDEGGALTLDFSDALDSWELDLDQVARAESTPLGRLEDEPLQEDLLEGIDLLPSDHLDSDLPPAQGARRAPPTPPPEARAKHREHRPSALPTPHPRAVSTSPPAERLRSQPAPEAASPIDGAAAEQRDSAAHEEERPTHPTEATQRRAASDAPRPVSGTTSAAPQPSGPPGRRMYEPPTADEIARLERASQPSAPAVPAQNVGELEPDSGATIIEPTADELLEAILEERPSSPAARRAESGSAPFDRGLPTPVVQAGDLQRAELSLPTPVVRAAEAPILEIIVDSNEIALAAEHYADESDVDPTDVSERPGWAEKRQRLARLQRLSQRAHGEAAAELLISAGELAEELSELAQATALYERALEQAPKHAAALRALARLGFRAGDMARHAQLLERASELAGPASARARTLAELALVRWVVQHDLPGALRAITEATQLAPAQLGYALLLARIEAATYPVQLDATLVPLAERTQDGALAAMWWVAAGRACEARGDLVGARALYTRAASADPFAFDAQLSLARMQHALAANADAARSLLRTLESFDIGPVAEAVRRRAAHMLGSEGQHAEAVELLEHASDDVSLRTAMQIAQQSGDATLQAQAADSWVLGADGPERALALLTQAELLAERGELSRAENALELAAIADPQQVLVAVAREALARRAGDPARLAEIAASEEAGRGALAAAAKLAAAPQNTADELTWLREARESDSAGLLPELLAIDTSAELARLGEVESLLDAASARGTVQARVRILVALAEVRAQRNDPEAARETLKRAAELAPGYAPAERPYARALESLEEAAAAYEREALVQHGARAAFLRLRAGFALPAGSSTRIEAFARAWELAPDYAPAAWALHREARQQGDLPRLSALHAREAERARDVRDQVAHLVRAALIRAGEDTETAAEQLTRALALAPEDPVLAELVIRLADAVPGRVRIAALERLAKRALPPFQSTLLLSIAGILEDEHCFDEAAERYREVLRAEPSDPIATSGLERAVSARGDAATRLPRLRRAVEEANTERERTQALEQLLLCETEPAQALETAHALLALSPSHALGLRTLERDAMTRGDRAALRAVQERSLRESRGPRDRAARVRLYQILHVLESGDDARDDDVDRKVIECASDAPHSLWLSRQLMSSAVALGRRDLVVRAVDLLEERTNDAVELAALAVQRAWLLLVQVPPGLDAALREALAGYPDHPTALELGAEVQRALGAFEAAAEQFEHAAKGAHGVERAAHLYARAAQLWDLELKRPERAKAAYMRAAEKALDYPGVQDRLAAILTEEGDVDGLIALTRARVDRSEGGEELTELRRKLAELYERAGDRDGARRVLREALLDDDDNLAAWRDLARLAERSGEPSLRVEALNAVVRLSRDPLELRDVLLELADVYETELPDPARAEAAYQRVLKLGPRNARALERIAALYKRQGRYELAIDALAQLIRTLDEGRARCDSTIELAAWKREQGDVRGAEELLEAMRRSEPTDRKVLAGLTSLLRDAGNKAALAIHLDRALSDLRHALAAKLGDVELHCALVEALVERGREQAAAQASETALALGLDAPLLHERLAGERGTGGIGSGALSELFDDLVYPESAPASLRILFRHAADALNRVAPLDLRALGAERLDKRAPLRAVVAEQARLSGVRDVDIYISEELPYAFVPIQDAPVQLLVGRRLLDALSSDEQQFLIARSLKLARAQMSIACRLRPAEMELWLHALVRQQVPSHAPTFIEAATLEEAARRLSKQLKRGAQHELAPHLLELTYSGMPRFDAASVYGTVSTAASRAALLAIGAVRPALSSLLKLSGATGDAAVPSVERVQQVEEARELALFALGEAFTEARIRAGKETS